MSLNEKKRSKHLPDIFLTEGISRSKSFAGLSHRRTNSADVKFSSEVGYDGYTTNVFHGGLGSVLGQSPSSNPSRNFVHGLYSTKISKPHKSPRPERTQIIFEAISKGLKDSILLAQNDISSSRTAFDSVSVSSALQMKATERYLKKLEFQLSKLEELKEQYDIQQKMREGIRNMAYAYILSPGKEKETALHSVKSGFKECTELMCSYESELESLMGTMLFEMKGIQGFARICCGDVFDVIIKHGDQKWKTRGRVIKNGQQLWENKVILFKSLFNDPLYIKAMEVRGLGKNVLLGNKYCEIRDLFSAHPQQMTINLNPSGSLKLNLIITWNPLHSIADGIHVLHQPPSTNTTYTCGQNNLSQTSISEDFSDLSLSAKECSLQHVNISDEAGQSYSSGSTSISAQSSEIASPDIKASTSACGHDNSLTDNAFYTNEVNSFTGTSQTKCKDSDFSDSQPYIPKSEDSSECCSIDMRSSSAQSQFSGRLLSEALRNLIAIMEDFSIKHQEMQALSSTVEEIDKLLKEKRCSTSDSNISVSIESALGCFDFLNSAIENDEYDNIHEKFSDDKSMNGSEINISLETSQVMDDNDQLTCSFESSPLYLTSGVEPIDTILMVHLSYCIKLIMQLSICAPIKWLENSILNKLKAQNSCLLVLLKLMGRKNSEIFISDFFLENESQIKKLWQSLIGDVFYCASDTLCCEIEKLVRSKTILEMQLASLVSTRLLSQILDVNQYDSEGIVTVLQFKCYFLNYIENPEFHVLELVTETIALEDLKSKDEAKVSTATNILSKITPSSCSLYVISSYLIENDTKLKSIAETYLRGTAQNGALRSKAISSYVEGLVSDNTSLRQGSSAALDLLDAKNNIEQLVCITPNNSVGNIQEDAKTSLRFSENVIKDSTL